jgi:hypothetical protein
MRFIARLLLQLGSMRVISVELRIGAVGDGVSQGQLQVALFWL